MRYLRYLALLGIFMLTASYSKAQVSVGIGIGPGYRYVGAAPVCSYGYYDYYPYECAPYGFYGTDYFVGGVFIGAGPWYRGYYGRSGYGYYGRGRGYARGYDNDRYSGRGYVRGYNDNRYSGRGNGYNGRSDRNYGRGNGYSDTPATTTVTPGVTTATPGVVDTVMAAVTDAAQVAVATMVVMGVKAPTATEAVDPAAADIGSSP